MSDPVNDYGNLNTPYSQEAEEATLGAVITDSQHIGVILKFLTPERFFILRHRYIWEAIGCLHTRGETIDYLTVCQQLKNNGRLTEIGGPAYITGLCNTTPASVHAEVYAHLVERFSIRRQGMAAADEIKAHFLDEQSTVEQVIENAQAALTAVKPPLSRIRPSSMKEVMGSLYDQFEDRIENGVNMLGIPTGFKQFDDILGGWRKNRLVIVGGRPGMGKTGIMLECGVRVSNQINPLTGQPYKVLFVSMEMSADELGERLISNKAHLSTQQILSANVTDTERTAMIAAIGELSKSSLFLDDKEKVLTPYILENKCRDFIADHGGLDMLIVDYLQLMTPDKPNKSREVEVASISRDLKMMARYFHVPIMVGCQLNREVEKRKNKRATLADLRESGAIEQDADVVMFPFFPGYYQKPQLSSGDFEIGIAKHRNGRLGMAKLKADWRYMDFTE